MIPRFENALSNSVELNVGRELCKDESLINIRLSPEIRVYRSEFWNSSRLKISGPVGILDSIRVNHIVYVIDSMR